MANARPILRLGTRGSLLAVAQSRLIAEALRRARPDIAVELVTIETRGDRDRATPLSTVQDPGFFSAELDAALICGAVDFCVHSLKDLGANRPDQIVRAAIPKRENPRDVIVFRGDVIDRLKRQRDVRIGSSSARRQFNVERFLRTALPKTGNEPHLRFLTLRGAVPDRLQRLHSTEDRLDGVVLALAGLNRLWGDRDGRRAIQPLLEDTRLMVLPLSACPTAPGQGALAIECRHDDRLARDILATLHDPASATLVDLELERLAKRPTKQRPAVGATAIDQQPLGPLLFVRGPESEELELIWNRPDRPRNARAWDGGRLSAPQSNDNATSDVTDDAARDLARDAAADVTAGPIDLTERRVAFVAHWHALADSVSLHPDARIWTSGVKSWARLAERGHWVEGCADNLGFDSIVPTLNNEFLRLPDLAHWIALTRRGAESSWGDSGVGDVVGTYGSRPTIDCGEAEKLRDEVRSATHFFWGSASQYQAVRAWLPAGAHHACGAGKTARALANDGVEELHLFPSRKEWQAWLR